MAVTFQQVLGVVLVLLGATGATLTQRRLDRAGRARLALLVLIPHGVLIGAGAAMVRGWDLWVAIVAGAVLVPAVGAVSGVRHRWEQREEQR